MRFCFASAGRVFLNLLEARVGGVIHQGGWQVIICIYPGAPDQALNICRQ